MIYTRAVAPTELPVTLAEAKRHLRVDFGDEDLVIASLIDAAVQHLDGRDGILNQALVTQTWEVTFGAPCIRGIEIDFGPVQSIVAVEYRVSGAYSTWDPESYYVRPAAGGRQILKPVSGYAWPTTDCDESAWKVTLTAGYGDRNAVPAPIKSAILIMVSDLYRNRDAKIMNTLRDNPTVDRLLAPYRRVGVA